MLPAYIGVTDREGSGVFDPVQETRTPHDFYYVDRKLGAVPEDLYSRIRSGNYRALLIIHYFGFCQNDMEKIAHLCKENQVVLIEDCAHTMFSVTDRGELGRFGDFCFYSLHKFLAVKDGGCLMINNSNYLHLLDSLPTAKPSLETLEMVAKVDLQAIREKRRTNYLQLLGLIGEVKGIKCMYPTLPDGIAPHNFPVMVKGNQRESLYFKLTERDIPVIALYYRMIDPIIEGPFPDAQFVSAHILNFPIHQDIQSSDIGYITKVLQDVI